MTSYSYCMSRYGVYNAQGGQVQSSGGWSNDPFANSYMMAIIECVVENPSANTNKHGSYFTVKKNVSVGCDVYNERGVYKVAVFIGF